MSRTIIMALLVSIIFLFSGCTTTNPFAGNTVSGGDGLIIDKFEPVISEKFSGDPIAFRVKLKNTGTETAYDVEASIANIEEFDIFNEPVMYIEEITSDIGNTGNKPEVSWSWDLNAPPVPSGTEVTFKPTMKVIYTYKAETTKSITIVPVTQLREMQNGGMGLPAETVSKSRGPVSLDIEMRGPIEYYDTKVRFPVSIILRNIGGGILCRDECADRDKDLNMLDIYLHTDDIEMENCDTYDIRMTGDTRTIVCDAVVNVESGMNDEQEVFLAAKKTIRLDTVYTYTITKSQEIRVSGR